MNKIKTTDIGHFIFETMKILRYQCAYIIDTII